MSEFAVSISELDIGFLAGFLEGEGSFRIGEQNAGTSYSCSASIAIRDDDQDLIEWLYALTGVGRLLRVPARATSRPQIRWQIDARDDCLELMRLVSRCGFRGRRAAEIALWSEALHVWAHWSGEQRRSRLRVLKAELVAARRFGGGGLVAFPLPDRTRLRRGYISGLVCAEGCFGMSNGRPRFSMHLRKDDKPLLLLLSRSTGLGSVSDHAAPPPLNPSSTWTVSARSQVAELLSELRAADLPGRKRTEMESWAVAVDELSSAHRLGVKPRKQLLQLAADHLRAARVYRHPPRAILKLPRRDVRSESLAALQAWAHDTPGRLSCDAYSRWRRAHPGTPTRNTIAGAFGSWHAAMDAAGLADRAARSAPTRAGGGAARRERLDRQRALVAAAVRRFEAEHGRIPRAMEFFKWRLVAAPDTPTQGTVYKLFPGGWAAVLEACQAA